MLVLVKPGGAEYRRRRRGCSWSHILSLPEGIHQAISLCCRVARAIFLINEDKPSSLSVSGPKQEVMARGSIKRSGLPIRKYNQKIE